MILHHYKPSPFAEKIRTMLGYTKTDWHSCISPPMPPRPIIDPLSGGYRRIPILQIGADIICDTQLISSEIAQHSAKPELSLETAPVGAAEFAKKTDSHIFMAVIATAPPIRILIGLFRQFPFRQMLSFIKDRSSMGVKPPPKKVSKQLLNEFQTDVEKKLGAQEFLFGDTPSIADFSAYHVIWFAITSHGDGFLKSYPNTNKWFTNMSDFGHGNYKAIYKEDVWALAKDNSPRPIPESLLQNEKIGMMVTVGPSDYAKDTVKGRLIGLDDKRCIIARETEKFGLVHVHFPVENYAIELIP